MGIVDPIRSATTTDKPGKIVATFSRLLDEIVEMALSGIAKTCDAAQQKKEREAISRKLAAVWVRVCF